jgi:hypothetical protein
MFSAQHAAIAQRLSRRPFNKPFVGDISIGPLIDANEIGAPARAIAIAGIAAFARTLIPSGTPKRSRTFSVMTAISAEVS